MFSTLIGQFDWPSMFVVVGIAVALAIAFSTWLAITPRKLQEIKLQNDRDLELAKYSRDVEITKINVGAKNALVAHRQED